MALLHDIQISLLDQNQPVAPALLKLRFLADKLGSEPLEDWVRDEFSGYKNFDLVPDYRIAPLIFSGNFANEVHEYKNHPIPNLIISEHIGEKAVSYQIHEDLPSIESKILNASSGDMFSIDVSNYIFLLQNKIYDNMVLRSIKANFGVGSLIRIQSSVRSRILDLTMELERRVIESTKIEVGGNKVNYNLETVKQVSQIFNQTINGNVTNIASAGESASISVNVSQGDSSSLADALIEIGLTREDAEQLAGIASAEKPESSNTPFGKKAREWFGAKLMSGIDSILTTGGKIALEKIAESFQKYYN